VWPDPGRVSLTDEQVDYYSRQIILPELGGVGQNRLLSSSALLRGHGAAFDTARTYLLGAGVGRIDVCGRPSTTLDFADPGDRNPDVSARTVSETVDRSAYDLLLDFAPDAGADCTGFPVRGEIGSKRSGYANELLVIPREAGCLSCCRTGSPPTALQENVGPAHLADPMAGAMAALAAVLWLAEISLPRSVRALRLADDSAAWSDTPTERTPRCPRSCRT
jgi:hypothetical protein